MPGLTIKNIPDKLYEKLKESAKLHHRSINSEIIKQFPNNAFSPLQFIEQGKQ